MQEALFTRDFGRLCQLVRVAGDLRQSDMAVLTRLSQAFLSTLESGGRRLTNIDKIVELLPGLGAPAKLTGPMLRMPPQTADEPIEWPGTRIVLRDEPLHTAERAGDRIGSTPVIRWDVKPVHAGCGDVSYTSGRNRDMDRAVR